MAMTSNAQPLWGIWKDTITSAPVSSIILSIYLSSCTVATMPTYTNMASTASFQQLSAGSPRHHASQHVAGSMSQQAAGPVSHKRHMPRLSVPHCRVKVQLIVTFNLETGHDLCPVRTVQAEATANSQFLWSSSGISYDYC